MSLLQVKLKADSISEIKEQILLSLDKLDKEELTNLKWYLLTRNEDEKTLAKENGKKEEISLNEDIEEPKIVEKKKRKKKKKLLNQLLIKVKIEKRISYVRKKRKKEKYLEFKF